MRNRTVITTFILLGLTGNPQLQILIFVFLFLTYVLSVTGNMTIITLTLIDSHLKTPTTILGFPSVQQRRKAFSTCSSHMIVVSIAYGSCIFIY
ncbi:hypothetical protein HPG69_018932, partial [Diceros bicornis minor]